MTISNEDIKTLTNCKNNLENVGLIMQGLNFVGDKIEKAVELIPQGTQEWIAKKTNSILMNIISNNLKTMSKGKVKAHPLNKTYKSVVAASGFGFGFLGAAGFAFDLALSTKFMMRSILDIARSKGEDLTDIETQLSCIEVFALGGNSKNDDGMNTSYYATRMALSSSIKAASKYVAETGATKIIEKMATGSPLMQLIAKIASRYEASAIEKFVAEGFPVVGAIGGASINLIFIHHFQKMAEAHFTVRQLERKYGEDFIIEKYNEIKVN